MKYIILIIVLYLLLFFSSKIKENIINTQRLKNFIIMQKLRDLFVIFSFLFIYIFIFRISMLLLEKKVLDLNELFFKLKIFSNHFIFNTKLLFYLFILFFLFKLFLVFKKILIQELKLSFLRTNYYCLNKYEKYFHYYVTFISWSSFLWYWIVISKLKLHKKNDGIFFSKKNTFFLKLIYYFFKYIGYFILIQGFIFDLLFNNGLLIVFSSFLPWFGLYQTFYILNKFFTEKLSPRYDSCCCDYLYPPAKYKIQKIDYVTVIEISKYLEDILYFKHKNFTKYYLLFLE